METRCKPRALQSRHPLIVRARLWLSELGIKTQIRAVYLSSYQILMCLRLHILLLYLSTFLVLLLSLLDNPDHKVSESEIILTLQSPGVQ